MEEAFVQEFVEGTDPKRVPRSQEKDIIGFEDMAVFDYIVWNTDRHLDNFLVVDNQAVPIDHGRCFYHDSQKKLQLIPWNLAGEELSGRPTIKMEQAILQLAEDEEMQKKLKKRLSGLLTDIEISSLFDRVQLVANLIKNQGDISQLLERVRGKAVDHTRLYKGQLVDGNDHLVNIESLQGQIKHRVSLTPSYENMGDADGGQVDVSQ